MNCIYLRVGIFWVIGNRVFLNYCLHFYPELTNDLLAKTERTPNLNQAIIIKWADSLGLKFTPKKEKTKDIFVPIDVLVYIYTVLNNPVYREKYKEFSKINFPKVPFPKDLLTSWELVKLGEFIY